MGFKPITINDSISNNFGEQDEQVYIFLDCIDLNHKDKKNKIFLQLEPQEVCATRDPVIKNQDYFDLILAWDEETVKNCKNCVVFPYGTAWVRPETMNINKRNDISFITSSKSSSHFDGYNTRHEIWRRLQNCRKNNFNFIKYMSPPFLENKNRFFETSKFSIIIESVKRNNYFTEKLLDSLITRTIPIYRGCPNIGNTFNTKGILSFETADECFNIINNINESTYDEMSEYIKENEIIANSYANIWSRVDIEVTKFLRNRK